MSINQQLELVKQKLISNYPAEASSAIFRHIQELEESGIDFGLPVGTKAKDFTLNNAIGEPVNLQDELAKGSVVLNFYRGGWCPTCNMQLRSYQNILPEIQALGGQLIAVSPQSPDNSISQVEKEELTFQVLSDESGRAADLYNILFEVPDYLQDVYKNYFGLDLSRYNATNRWILPVPSTFIIDKDGMIQFRHIDPYFLKRMEPQEIIEQLRKL